MKKNIIVLLALLCGCEVWGQQPAGNANETNAGQDATPAPPTLFQKLKQRGTWTTFSTPALKLNQHYYQNWSSTGISQIAFLTTYDGGYKYSAPSYTWDNVVNLALGLYWQDLDGDTSQHGLKTLESRRKNEDKIDLTSTFSMKLREPWNLNVIANLKTQFFEGYKYTLANGVTQEDLISNFMAPGYLTTAIGFECKKEFWNLSLSFLTGKTTFVLDEKVIGAGQLYGVDTTGGKRVYAGLGSYAKFYYKKDVAKNLNLYLRYELFYDYRKAHNHDNITKTDLANGIAEGNLTFGGWQSYDMLTASKMKRFVNTLFHDTDVDVEGKLEYRFNSWLACYGALRLKYDTDFNGTHRFMGKDDSHWQLYESAGVQIYFNWKTPHAAS